MLSLDGLNDALSQNGLLKANEMAYRFYIGERFIYRKVVMSSFLSYFVDKMSGVRVVFMPNSERKEKSDSPCTS
jgi:hypothetical protein